MSPKKLSIIKERFKTHQPLNLSAVEAECPDLLEGLFEPTEFIGWRATLEEAGLSYDNIMVFPSIEVKCEICGFSAEKIDDHLRNTHGITSKEYRQEFPFAEIISEKVRAAKMGHKQGKKSKSIMPHWEPAWSPKYFLDRLFTCHKNGFPLNYSYYAKNESGMAAYGRKIFGTWDNAVQQIGVLPKVSRQAKPKRKFTKASLIKKLKNVYKDNPQWLSLPWPMQEIKSVISACIAEFASYENALEAAGILPAELIPALHDEKLLRMRSQLINAAKRRVNDPDKTYDLEAVAKFTKRYQSVVNQFYGDWHNFCVTTDTTERILFHIPSHDVYHSKEVVIEALQERDRVGLSLRSSDLALENRTLLTAATKHCGTYPAALENAGLKAPEHSYRIRKYKEPEDVIKQLRRRKRQSLSLYHIDVVEDDRMLIKWAIRFFGSYREALTAANIPWPGIKPHEKDTTPLFPDSDAVIQEIRNRVSEGKTIAKSQIFKKLKAGGDRTLYLAASKYFDGGWMEAVAIAGYSTGIIHYDPDAEILKYHCAEDVIDAIQRRYKKGKTLNWQHRHYDTPFARLIKRAESYFDSWQKALEIAGINHEEVSSTPEQPMSKQEVIEAIRERHIAGLPMRGTDMLNDKQEAKYLYRRATRLFKNWGNALKAAGISL